MKARTLDLLIDLMSDITGENQSYESHRPVLAEALQDAGINRGEVLATLDWLDGIIEGPTTVWETDSAHSQHARRILTQAERNKIPLEGKQFLKKLENLGIINTITRERIIDSVMACEADEISFEQLQWIAYMVIANHLEGEIDFDLLDSVFDAPENLPVLKH